MLGILLNLKTVYAGCMSCATVITVRMSVFLPNCVTEVYVVVFFLSAMLCKLVIIIIIIIILLVFLNLLFQWLK